MDTVISPAGGPVITLQGEHSSCQYSDERVRIDIFGSLNTLAARGRALLRTATVESSVAKEIKCLPPGGGRVAIHS